jgi:HAMP domain-containing protein
MFTQGLAIASAEVILSFTLLGITGLLLTRHIRSLVSAMQRVTAGDYSIRIPVRGRDEITLLACNFDAMSNETRERVEALHRSEQALLRRSNVPRWPSVRLVTVSSPSTPMNWSSI